jgi:hypothetical protein
LLYEPLIPGVSTPLLGTIALWVAAILTLWSMFHYLRLAAPHFREPAPRAAEPTPRLPEPPAVAQDCGTRRSGRDDPLTASAVFGALRSTSSPQAIDWIAACFDPIVAQKL